MHLTSFFFHQQDFKAWGLCSSVQQRTARQPGQHAGSFQQKRRIWDENIPQQQSEQSGRDRCLGEEELHTSGWELQAAFSGYFDNNNCGKISISHSRPSRQSPFQFILKMFDGNEVRPWRHKVRCIASPRMSRYAENVEIALHWCPTTPLWDSV